MSGHSKWSKVKHQKEATDSAKGKIFTKLANSIIIAVREGGGNTDPESNFKLRLAIDKAKNYNMPKENISRAIERGKGSSAGEDFREVIFEAFGPFGVGFIIQSATANNKRTVSELKNTLERSQGVLATNGAVSHLFEQVGSIEVKKDKPNDETLEKAIELGAVDFKENDDCYSIITSKSQLHQIKDQLANLGYYILSCELIYKPLSKIPLISAENIEKVEKLIEVLEDRDDVQRVFANYSTS